MGKRVLQVARKYIEYIHTKIVLLWRQRTFTHEDVKVKYMLNEVRDSDCLVVVFSACTRQGLKARYNYVKTLNEVACNRLYILDDYAADHRGSYYLGHDFRFDEEAATRELICTTIGKTAAKKLIFCGSSKGGYAALNFGLEYPDAFIVAGAPQYFLASYLACGNEITLRHIIGEQSEEKNALLDERLREKIRSEAVQFRGKIYLHYSDAEHTYKEHVQYLLEDLRQNGYTVETDIEHYENHSEISLYFPDFLKRTVKSII